jgi:hypothetical protein
VPALVTVSLLVVFLGWLGFSQFRNPSALRTAWSPVSKEEVTGEDLEVIENLELLEQMEVLEKVVRAVDQRNVKL